MTGRTKERVAQSKRARTGLLATVARTSILWGRGRCYTAYIWRCLFLVLILSIDFFFFLCCPLRTGLLSLNSLFPSIYDLDGCATTAAYLVSGWVFYFVTTGWIFEISLCENSIHSCGGVSERAPENK